MMQLGKECRDRTKEEVIGVTHDITYAAVDRARFMKLEVRTRHQDTRKIEAYAIFSRYSWKAEVGMLQDGECEGGINALCLLGSTWQCWCRVLVVESKGWRC
jgi:hypothetical protein